MSEALWTNPTVPTCDLPRVKTQAWTILEALRSGPKLNTELAAITHRFGARVHELRRMGWRIVTVPLSDGTGRVTYRLVVP